MSTTTAHTAHALTRWDAFLSILTRGLLDPIAQKLGAVPGLFIPSRRGCGAGVFFYPQQSPSVEAWSEPGAWVLRLGRVELQIDQPSKD